MSEEDSFLRLIAQHPEDDTNRLIFADWLEEHGDWRGGFLRLACTLRAMAEKPDSYAAIEKCWRILQAALDQTWGVRVMSPPEGPVPAENPPEYHGPARPEWIMDWAGL